MPLVEGGVGMWCCMWTGEFCAGTDDVGRLVGGVGEMGWACAWLAGRLHDDGADRGWEEGHVRQYEGTSL